MRRYIFVLLFCVLFAACYDNTTEKILRYWLGRELDLATAKTSLVMGVDPMSMNNDFYVVSYVDSLGCVPCKLALNKQKGLFAHIDKIAGKHVPIIFIVEESVKRDFVFALKADRYKPDCVIIDKNRELSRKYSFPADVDLQTFLLDKTRRVVAVGNPVHKEEVLNLYIKLIKGR